jgi:hypothetical protein
MTKHKILIQIFPLVTDIDLLERSLLLLKQSSLHIDKDKFHIILDVTLPLTDYLVDWENSILKQDFFIDKFNSLKKYGDWADECYFNIDYNLLGCVDCCINNINKYDVDSIIWLEVDIIFNQYTLNLFLESSLEVKKSHTNYIITSEYIKLWDNTWDVLVNENFLNKLYNYWETHDPLVDSSVIYGDILLEPINTFKFGGGWFTLFSKPLLDYIKFPKDIKGYCPIDTFIMNVCPYIPNSTQFKIKNLIVCQDKTYSNNTLYKNYVKSFSRKHDPELDSWNKLIKHWNKLILK